MQYTTFARQYGHFLTDTVRRVRLELEGPEGSYGLGLSVVSLPPEDGPLDYLSAAEKEQYFGFRYPKRRNSYLLGKLAAKMAVAGDQDDLAGIEIQHGILFQPMVAGSTRRITITHCDTLGAAVDYDPRLLAGVDMELVDEKAVEGIRRITSKREEALNGELGPELAPPVFLTLLWTAKEAMSKVIQTGFTVPTELFEIRQCTRDGQGVISLFKNFPQFKALSILRREYVYTLVLPAKAMTDSSEARLLQALQELLPD
ncbi:4'-phosphopantetheinyl transferase superfamily protein [Paenibacillus tritici]|uniref:4'-phosphopantetheinyl transferase superfamily protein n=1 Tax=Paenibacillus tritici TaxID=1873425 RepID=A0ABX2DT60_9BACL|nr:4'-phosphopantetheinyl transferase superfamily protein [Paenibacillus tritici]NQX47862.1 4'-phosphopantetheinyl transferase superfamily protein [Paenibacillus tritici]